MKKEKKNSKKFASKTARTKFSSPSQSKSKSNSAKGRTPSSKAAASATVNKEAASSASRSSSNRTRKSQTVPAKGKTRQKPPQPHSARTVSQPRLRRSDIPPILLERDQPNQPNQPDTPDKPGQPSQPGPAVSGVRYALGLQAPGSHTHPIEDLGELPEAYGTQRLLITARDPHWLYAHWDFTRDQLRQFNARSVDGHLILRVFRDRIEGDPCARVHVHPESRNWFVHVGQGGSRYVAEIGYRQPDGEWIPVAHSGATLTPPDAASEDITVRFETIPVDLPFNQLLGVLKSALRESLPLAEALRQIRSEGPEQLPDAPAIQSGHWSAEQEQAMANLISMDQIRRIWMGSLEITELVRRHLGREMASIGAAQFPQAKEAWSGAVSSAISSPMGERPAQRKPFWFNVNAELILYGATEPDATVRIGNRTIRLRPDGSFSFRFALPDGEYQLPVVAIAADESEERAADLAFKRATTYRGDVGTHPQSAQLQKPDPENLP